MLAAESWTPTAVNIALIAAVAHACCTSREPSRLAIFCKAISHNVSPNLSAHCREAPCDAAPKFDALRDKYPMCNTLAG